MSAIPALKKKLKSVKTTEKISKAMKTVSAAKFSKLSALNKSYSEYAKQFEFFFENSENEEKLPGITVVMGSNRGFCGSFNNDIINFFIDEVYEKYEHTHLIFCGEELISSFAEIGILPDEKYVFDDIPSFGECEPFFKRLKELSKEKNNCSVGIVYPVFKNTLNQIPYLKIFYPNGGATGDFSVDSLWFPDKESVLEKIREKGFNALIFSAIRETATCAQASTLMTMRSAYDNAKEYTEELEGEIHRLRQSEVTSDVIETSSERSGKGDEKDG